MKVRLYTDEEINKLNNSIFVRSVKYKREIEYDPLFKLWTIVMKHDLPELSAREIFARGGIDINIVHKKLPQRRIKEWIDNYESSRFTQIDEYTAIITSEYNMDCVKEWLAKNTPMRIIDNLN